MLSSLALLALLPASSFVKAQVTAVAPNGITNPPVRIDLPKSKKTDEGRQREQGKRRSELNPRPLSSLSLLSPPFY